LAFGLQTALALVSGLFIMHAVCLLHRLQKTNTFICRCPLAGIPLWLRAVL
jgi:hypothetical protein